MYKPDVLAKFPKEVQDLAMRGVYTLFESKIDNSLLAKTSTLDCFKFDSMGSYGATLPCSSIDFSKYEQLDTVSSQQLSGLIKAVKF